MGFRYQQLQEKLDRGEKLRVAFINDVGFQYGAGIAHLRQMQSFLRLGHEVIGFCGVQGKIEASVPIMPPQATGNWLGMNVLSHLHPALGLSQDTVTDNLVFEVQIRYPDLIIVGNIHGCQWPVRLLKKLQAIGCPVVAFLHDCYFLTGRCAYTGTCTLYQTGCNETCPTWQQYPSLAPEKIFDDWLLRRQVFCGSDRIPLAANSQWMLSMIHQAFRGMASADCLYYGLDAQLFRRIDKALARKMLGIPQDRFVVLGGAVSMKDARKGGHLFMQVVEQLQDQCSFLVFGDASQQMRGVIGTGFLQDYRRMPLVYSAADVFVGTSLEEAFGQTFCEAAACSVPVVAFKLDGIPEVARPDRNARLAEEISAAALVREIEFFRQNPDQQQEYGAAGRAMVEAEFTLEAQGERWMNYLKQLALDL